MAKALEVIWWGRPIEQLSSLPAALPQQEHQLFELETLGSALVGLPSDPNRRWSTHAPIAAAKAGLPCLKTHDAGISLEVYYQTLPREPSFKGTIYRSATEAIRTSKLRPDLLIRASREGLTVEVMVECKYSTDPQYVASGVPQLMAYSVEYPEPSGVERVYVAVGPETVVGEGSSTGAFSLSSPVGLGRRMAAIIQYLGGAP